MYLLPKCSVINVNVYEFSKREWRSVCVNECMLIKYTGLPVLSTPGGSVSQSTLALLLFFLPRYNIYRNKLAYIIVERIKIYNMIVLIFSLFAVQFCVLKEWAR